jgi:hypothetical protein
MAWLHRLARLGDITGVRAALATGDDPNAVTPDGWTPLLLASREGHAEVVAALLTAGASPGLAHTNGRRPLDFAAANGNVEVIRMLAAANADVNTDGGIRGTPLLAAAMFNHRETVEILLALGANGEARDSSGNTAADWLQLGGLVGVTEAQLERTRGPRVDGLIPAGPGLEGIVRRKMAEQPDADRYAAVHGRNVWCCSYGLHRFEDAEVHAWAHRVAAILADRALLTACEERFLTGEELAEARVVRARVERRARRRPRTHLPGSA